MFGTTYLFVSPKILWCVCVWTFLNQVIQKKMTTNDCNAIQVVVVVLLVFPDLHSMEHNYYDNNLFLLDIGPHNQCGPKSNHVNLKPIMLILVHCKYRSLDIILHFVRTTFNNQSKKIGNILWVQPKGIFFFWRFVDSNNQNFVY